MLDPKAQEEAASKGFATLSARMSERVTKDVLQDFSCQGRPVELLLQQQIAEEQESDHSWTIYIAATSNTVLFICIL